MRPTKIAIVVLIIPLALSTFTHLWNPVGFPDLFFDEGVYMRRAMNVLQGGGPQEAEFYDHPYFGQFFLAGMLAAIGYPSSLNPDGSVQSMQTLYAVPRIVMGILAVLDTFLVFKIAEKRYDRRVALIASIIFAVMPITWLFRRILLDSILMPFLLSSILVALHTRDSKYAMSLAMFSGVFLGLAIFTKIPAFTMIPLVGFIITSGAMNRSKRIKMVCLFLAPAILIPIIWPVYSISVGQFDLWTRDVLWQSHRESGGIALLAGFFFSSDPAMMAMGIAGIGYCLWKRDLLIALWALPFILFLSFIGYVQYFHFMPIIPVLAIAFAKFVIEINDRLIKWKRKEIILISTVGIIATFGVVMTTLLITTNVTSAQFEALSFTAKYLKDNAGGDKVTTLSGPVYSWILKYVLHNDNIFNDYSAALFYPINTNSVVLLIDKHFQYDVSRGEQLQKIYNNTQSIRIFKGQVSKYDTTVYPYWNMFLNQEGDFIDFRVE